MTRDPSKILSLVLAAAFVCSAQLPLFASTIPSRAQEERPGWVPSGVPVEADAREQVARALMACGLEENQVEQRLALLSEADIRHLADNLEQIQSAGTEVPEYVWWLVAGLLGVLILTAVF